MKAKELHLKITSGGMDELLVSLYGKDKLDRNRKRYQANIESFISMYGNLEAELFSVPGRSEISGNHTDHNCGKVLAAAVDLDIIAIASKTKGKEIKVKSDGYREDLVDLNKLEQYKTRKGGSVTLVAGIARNFEMKNRHIGGFVAHTTSDVLSGSGISSSAAFEVMIGTILNHFYNNGEITPIEVAISAQYAENVYFGKPCGLMDQTACVVGGFSFIDFENVITPITEKLDFDLAKYGYELFIINTGGNHSDLTEDYAAIPSEMKNIAASLGKTALRATDEADFFASINVLREKHGDRAVLRTFHFYNENKRVEKQREALKNDDITEFLKGVDQSGNSSYKYLQNVYTPKNIKEQGIALAYAVLENMGVHVRVHGGGFAGTVQAFVKFDQAEEVKNIMEKLFGINCCMILNIRSQGAVKLT